MIKLTSVARLGKKREVDDRMSAKPKSRPRQRRIKWSLEEGQTRLEKYFRSADEVSLSTASSGRRSSISFSGSERLEDFEESGGGFGGMDARLERETRDLMSSLSYLAEGAVKQMCFCECHMDEDVTTEKADECKDCKCSEKRFVSARNWWVCLLTELKGS